MQHHWRLIEHDEKYRPMGISQTTQISLSLKLIAATLVRAVCHVSL